MTDPKVPQEKKIEAITPLPTGGRNEGPGERRNEPKPSKRFPATEMTLPNGDPPSWMLWGADE